MKKTIIKITFKDGSVGYYKSSEIVTSFRDQAKIFDKKHAEGFVEGLNFAFQVYEDALVKNAETEEL